jgi:hypothetical protein
MMEPRRGLSKVTLLRNGDRLAPSYGFMENVRFVIILSMTARD